uniref:FAD-binding protein n=1 Tax=Volvariella volvacea TaxID=36659 RepID=M9Z2U8_9AGAR|nr:FAD-binding protein [Volvariella volvacea]
MPSQSKLRIAIIGGGLGGLIAARAILCKTGPEAVEIDVYEATSKMTEIGAGIVIWPRTWSILKKLGMEEYLMKLLASPPDKEPSVIFRFRKSDQKEGVLLHDMIMNGGTMRFHRAELQQAILDSLQNTAIRFHLSHRLKEYQETGQSIKLMFEDGSVAQCDYLIGADGIKSSVRRQLILSSPDYFKDDIASLDPMWSGSYAYRGLIPIKELEKLIPNHRATKNPMMYCGKSKDQLINVVAFVSEPEKEGTLLSGPQVEEVSQEEFRAMYVGWEPEVQAIISCIKSPKRWAIQALHPMSRYGVGRVLLIGDAAHAMTPHLGSGAGQAIEDGYVLANVIASYISDLNYSTREITEAYNRIRRPFGNKILTGSRTQGFWCEFNAPGLEGFKEGDDGAEYVEELKGLMRRVHKAWEWAWDTAIPGVERVGEMAVL